MSFDIAKYPTLALVNSTQELQLLPKESLPKLCNKLHHYLLNSMSHSSRHFASRLGTVKLTMALHYVYNTPFDQLIWDVGHQAYPHKILTRHHNKISTIHQKGSLHPFPWHSKSKYDILSIRHSSTSISARIGIAVAAKKEGKNHHTICVISNGAITTGMAFEAMNHTGNIHPDMLVVLNNNEMSISKNVSALNNHLAQLLSSKLYSSLHKGRKKVFSGIPPIKELLKHTKEHIKGMVVPGTLFEELGFNYISPVDSHNVLGLITTLKNMRDLKGPQFLHIMTKKGHGYEPAEKDPITFHTMPKFDPSSSCLPKSSSSLPSYSKIFGNWLCETAAKDNKLMAITPAMHEGSSMVKFSHKFPDHYFNMAIAKQHTVTFATSLAIGGYKPIVTIYSTFLQHAYDQVLHDMAIQKLPVLFTIDHTGIVGADSQTHQGTFDLSYLHCIPEMVIMTPSNENKCRQMLYTSYHYNNGPSTVHYPRSNTVGMELTPLEKLPIGKGIVKHHGKKLAILNFGTLMPEAAKVAKSLNTTLVNIHFVKPLDEALILEMATSHEALVTIEENTIMGSAGSRVNKVLMAHHKPVPMLNIGLPDFFIPQGTQEEMHAKLSLNATSMEAKIKAWLA